MDPEIWSLLTAAARGLLALPAGTLVFASALAVLTRAAGPSGRPLAAPVRIER